MNVIVVCGFALAAAGALAVLKRLKPEFAEIAAATAGVVMLVYILDGLIPFFETANAYAGALGVSDYFAVMLKALAISVCCRMSADVCRDCGENGIASKVELAGKAATVLLSLPIIKRLLESAKELMP